MRRRAGIFLLAIGLVLTCSCAQAGDKDAKLKRDKRNLTKERCAFIENRDLRNLCYGRCAFIEDRDMRNYCYSKREKEQSIGN